MNKMALFTEKLSELFFLEIKKEVIENLSDEELILKSNDWIDSLKGTTSQLDKKLSKIELIQLGKKLIAIGR